jgi:N-acyl-L-homoserine lactone synthetase
MTHTYSHILPDEFISIIIKQDFVKKGGASYPELKDVSSYDDQCSIVACGNDTLKLNIHHHIRFLGFCEERNIDPDATIMKRNGLSCETDEFDPFAEHYLIKDNKTDEFFGAFRKFRFDDPQHLPGFIRSQQQQKFDFEPKTVEIPKVITHSRSSGDYTPLTVELQARSMLELSRFVLSKKLRMEYGISSDSFMSTARLVMADAFTQAARQADDLMIFVNQALIKRLKQLNITSYAQQPPVKAYGNRLTCLFNKENFEQFVHMSPGYMNSFHSVVDVTKGMKPNENHYFMLRILHMNLEAEEQTHTANKTTPNHPVHKGNIERYLGTVYPEYPIEKHGRYL